MDYKVLYRKYRPKNFSELIDQESIKDVLINSIKSNKIAHAYIFTGPRGTGKTSTAKIFAKTLNCLDNKNGLSCDKCEMCLNYNESADIIEIDAASNNGVDEIRSLRENVTVAPYNSKYKIYIIDEVHMLSNSAWNAFLKTLEEPPAHVIFILATTELNKVPETVKSRCQIFNFTTIALDKMRNRLSEICNKEDIEITDEALEQISKMSNGCLRDALSYLDKISKYNKIITIELIKNTFGVLDNKCLDDLYNSIINGDSIRISEKLDKISEDGVTPVDFINSFLEYLLNKVISTTKLNQQELNIIKDIINKLNELSINFTPVVNPYILIKVELITVNYFPGNNSEDIESKKKEKNVVNDEKNDIEEDNLKKDSLIDLKKIRVNNSFVNASKTLKKEMTTKWKTWLDDLNKDNKYNLLGYSENACIEVVSPTNILFSFKSESDAVIFNSKINQIEDEFNKYYNLTYKFFGLIYDEWEKEKERFINNKKIKYEYIDEEKVIKSEETVAEQVANDLFGNSIIEIK